MSYGIIYSPEALDDLRAIFSCIAYEKLAPENAAGQVNRIRKAVRKDAGKIEDVIAWIDHTVGLDKALEAEDMPEP